MNPLTPERLELCARAQAQWNAGRSISNDEQSELITLTEDLGLEDWPIGEVVNLVMAVGSVVSETSATN